MQSKFNYDIFFLTNTFVKFSFVIGNTTFFIPHLMPNTEDRHVSVSALFTIHER